MKVLVVGFDGATFDVIRPLVQNGRLPTLAHLLQTGAWGPLRSILPPVTPAAWTSFFTGKNPGKHGLYDFEQLDKQNGRFTLTRTDLHREKSLWHLLGDADKRAIILDVPFTYPPQPLNGLMITGYGTPRTPETVFTYPFNLAEQLPAALRREIRHAVPTYTFDRSPDFINAWWEIMDGRARLLPHFLTHEPWDLFMVVFSITDNMAHVFWTYVDPGHPNYHKPEAAAYRDAFYEGYARCDALLGDLMRQAGPDTTTLVLSDHGFGSVRPRQYIYQRLLAGGYLQPRQVEGGLMGRTPAAQSLLRLALNTYQRFPFLREWVKSLRPERRRQMKLGLQKSNLLPGASSLDLTRSPLIVDNFGLRLWANDNGRFPTGPLPAADRHRLLAEVADFLLADRDPLDGRPIIAHVHWGRDLYHGPFADDAPDLVIEYANFHHPGLTPDKLNPYTEGSHTLEGIFLAGGSAIQPTHLTTPFSLIDLAPTILHLLEQPIPPDMDGRVLTDIFTPTYLASHPIHQGTTPAQYPTTQEIRPGNTTAQDEEIRAQLRQLGYVE